MRKGDVKILIRNLRKMDEKKQLNIANVRRIGIVVSPSFAAECNALCDKITKGMKGLNKPHNFKSNAELILAILKIKADDFSPYA